MFKDEMTPMERAAALAAGQAVDRLPFSPILGETAAHLIGATIPQYRHSAQVMVDVELAVYDMFGQDGAGTGPGYPGLAEAMGTKLKYPENNIPFVIEPAIKDWNELSRLEPVDPYHSGKLPLYLEALKMLKDKMGKVIPVGSCIGGPFSTAAFIRGTDSLLRDLRKDPEKVHRLLEIVTASALNYIDAVIDLGCGISIADPVASGTMISADNFREFVKPYMKTCADRVRERTGQGPMLHICGNSSRIWRDMLETGAATLSLDNVVSLADARAQVGSEVCLMGNVDPVSIVARGTPEQIREAVRLCLLQAGDNPGGFVLATGCQIPLEAPAENILCFAEAARTLGKYPLDMEALRNQNGGMDG